MNIRTKRVRLWRAVTIWLLLAATAWIAAPGSSAIAQTIADEPDDVLIYGIEQQDHNRDGAPDLTIIRCAIETPEDRVLVYDGAGNMRRANTWQEATDFTDDTWVFQIGGSSRAHTRLIIAFATEGRYSVARLYDGSASNGAIRYMLADTAIQVIEPAHPTMTIRANGAWVHPDGTLNYNLNWQCDGPTMNREHARQYPAAFALDGEADAEGVVRDVNRDGVPEYSWYTLLAAVPESEGIPRSSAQVNSGKYRPADPENIIFWPLLNRPKYPETSNYFDTPLFLGMDWESGLIESFSFRGYPIEDGYHINTPNTLERGRVNTLQFENPMAYYDLAQDRDGRPEMFIRFTYTPPGIPFFISGGPTRSPIEMVQYSWNQGNHPALIWDYKLDLAGTNYISRTTSLGDITLEMVPHAELPRWVAANPWGFATLVAFETGDAYHSAEGIYEWSTLEGVQNYADTKGEDIPRLQQIQRDYLAGVSSQSPVALYQDLPEGYRGEYATINDKAWLYYSPVDARLHLVGASWGVYNGGNGRRLEYHNLDENAYIDTWKLFLDDTQVAQLHQSRNHLLLGMGDQVMLRSTNLPPQFFRTQQPTNHAEWASLGAQLAAHERGLEPDDLKQMLQTAPGGPTMTIHRATLSDYRPLPGDGFRFALDLRPGFTVEGAMLLPLSRLTPGRYVVTYQDEFTIEPLTPAQLTISPLPKGLLLAPAIEWDANSIGLHIRNSGLEDATDVLLRVTAMEAGEPVVVGEREVTVLAGETTQIMLPWNVPHAGEWTIHAAVFHAAEADEIPPALAEYEQVVHVAPTPMPSFQQTLSAFGLVPSPMILGLFVSALIVSGAGLTYLSRLRSTDVEDTD